MTDLEIRSDVKLMSSPGDLLPPVLSASPHAAAERFGISALMCLSGLGIAGIVTILAFFGTGFLLLSNRLVDVDRSPPPKMVAANPFSATAIGAAAAAAPLAAGESNMAGSPAKAEIASAPIAPLNKTPAPTASREKAAPILLAPGRGSDIVAATPRAAASHVAVSALPILPQQLRQTGPITMSSAAPSVPADPASSPTRQGGADVAVGPTPSEPLPAAQVRALLVEGDDAFRRGDLTSARLLYRRAYEAGDGRGALGMGASYDPLFLRQFRIWTQISDPDEARLWYLRAQNLGVSQADNRLKYLDAKSLR